MTFNEKLCEERKDSCKREFDAVWKRLNGQDRKLWTIIILLVTQLAGAIVALALSCKLYVCCICKQTFRRYGSWKYHKTITGHDEVKYVKSMKFTCRLCGKEVDVTGKELAVALAMCDDPEELEFTCESCECQQSGAVA